MNLYDDPTTVADAPALPAAGAPGYFTDGVLGGQARTIIRAWWLNLVATELVAIVVAGGLNPARNVTNQVLQAIRFLIQAGAGSYAVDTGAANGLVAALTPAPAALAAGLTAKIKVAYSNTGTATLNLNGLGVKPIVTPDGQPLTAGLLTAGGIATLLYDGTSFQLQNGSSYTQLASVAEAKTGTSATKAITPADAAATAQANSFTYAADSSGAANTVTVALAPALPAYAAGQTFKVKIANTNTGPATININGLGAATIQWNGRALVGGELAAGKVVELVYDGADFQIQGLAAVMGSNANGSYRISQDGFIEQWIVYPSAITTEQSITRNYPISFPNAVLGITGTTNNSSSNTTGSTVIQTVGAPGLSSATFFIQDQSSTFPDAAGGFFAKVEGY